MIFWITSCADRDIFKLLILPWTRYRICQLIFSDKNIFERLTQFLSLISSDRWDTVSLPTKMSSNLEKFMDMSDKEAYQLLQHNVCHDYKTSQTGNEMGGVHHRHNAHKLYLIPKMDVIEHVKRDEDRPSKCDKVTIKMISPAQAILERAESEIRHRKKEESLLPP